MRTTIDIDDAILREIKAIHKSEGRSMGSVVSELLTEALALRRATHARPARLSMRNGVDAQFLSPILFGISS